MAIIVKLLILISSGIVVTVAIILTANLPNKQLNGFTRHFLIEETLSPESSNRVESNVRQIISVTSKKVYLSTNSPNKIYVRDHKLKHVDTSTISLHDTVLNAIGNAFALQLRSPYAYIFASNIPAVIRHAINNEGKNFIPIPGPPFSYAVALSESSFILRQFLEGGNDKHFVKYNAISGTMRPENEISLPSVDGGLSTDGQLHYDRAGNRLLYMHYYNNNVLSFDTNLVLINRFHTIDTISNKHHLGAGAPLIINQKSCVYNGLLLVCSNLKADNEPFRKYRNNIPVDIYEIATGRYKGSFYLPLSRGKLIKSMKAYGNKLATLYHDNRLSLFKLPF